MTRHAWENITPIPVCPITQCTEGLAGIFCAGATSDCSPIPTWCPGPSRDCYYTGQPWIATIMKKKKKIAQARGTTEQKHLCSMVFYYGLNIFRWSPFALFCFFFKNNGWTAMWHVLYQNCITICFYHIRGQQWLESSIRALTSLLKQTRAHAVGHSHQLAWMLRMRVYVRFVSDPCPELNEMETQLRLQFAHSSAPGLHNSAIWTSGQLLSFNIACVMDWQGCDQ